MDYINLHSHTIFSIRDSIVKPKDLVARAKDLGHLGVAVTDHGTVGAGMLIYKEAKKHGLKPILGAELYIATRHRTQKESGIDSYYHITLLAMNLTGWKNLCHLVYESNKADHFYSKPRIDRELLRRYNEGLICLSGCLGGNLANAIMKDLKISFRMEEGDDAAVETVIECAKCNELLDGEKCEDHRHTESYNDVVSWYQSVFKDRYYLEVQNHNQPQDRKVNEVIFDIAARKGIKVVATGDTHVVNEHDIVGHDIMLTIRDRITIHDEKMARIKYPGDGYHLMSSQDMKSRFPGHEEVVSNTMEIYERCNLEFNLGDFKLPHVVDIREEDDVFRKLVMEGLSRKFKGNIPPEYVKRAEEEIRTIIQMTFPSYFMIVSDYMRFARNNGIPVGPGRGSAAGSLVAYALDITEVDPLVHDTSFARFLNAGRSSVPVINFKEFSMSDYKNLSA